ncbi:MAG TPA: large-conductance mechanosensitive channel protein MscL [candidate division Zixibacteria bacterium]|nr:large-conductance mechanosensitive channel protein MscL [candidate division Zixibacteria bacterium]
MVKEFREFIMRGSVVDLAVGLVIGAAFGAIVTSFVDDILMPPIGMLLGGVNFSELFIPLDGNEYATLAIAQEAGAPTINYGLFIMAIIYFLIVALVIFFIIRALNRMRREEEVAPAEPTSQNCPFCTLEISLTASRCPHCTSQLEATS